MKKRPNAYGYIICEVIADLLKERGVDAAVVADLHDYKQQRAIVKEAYIRQTGSIGCYRNLSE